MAHCRQARVHCQRSFDVTWEGKGVENSGYLAAGQPGALTADLPAAKVGWQRRGTRPGGAH